MAATIKLKKSSVSSNAPGTGDLQYGEVAINYADGRLYYKNSSNVIKNFIDSDLIDLRVTNLVDSAYVQARQAAATIGSANQIILDNFTGDSATTNFVLTHAPITEQHVLVSINGVVQHTSAYTLTNNTLTFSEAPGLDDSVEVRTFRLQNGDVELRDYKQYVYQPSVATTLFSGSDINGDVLTYDVGKVEVYLNGVQLVKDLDFTANTSTSITLLGSPGADSGDTVVVTSLSRASFLEILEKEEVPAATTALLTTTADQVVDTWASTVYRSAKYIIQMTQGSRYHSAEVLLTHNGTTAYMTQYADIFTESDLGTFNADVSSGLVRLLVSPNYTNTTVKTKRINIEV